MERIGDAVRGELGRFGSTGSMADLVEAWPQVVGETVAASSSVWAFELGQLAGEILPRLRETLGKAAPKRLRFAPGPLPEAVETASRRRKPPPLEPTAEHVREARSWAAAISSEELRKTVEKAARASLARAGSGRSVW